MEDGGTLYFGYGSNLDWDDWKSWCEKKNLRFEGLVEVSPCWLPNYSMKFHYYSGSREGGAADVVETGRGHAVPGVLFRMDDATLKAMDRKEGIKFEAYERRKVQVILPNGTFVDALTYCVTEKRKENRFIQPTTMYSNLILNGLKKRKLPIEELKNAIENFTPSYPIENLFVYGTLMHGEQRHSTLVECCVGEGISATASGTILDLGNYPGMIAGDNGVVQGEIYQIDQVYPALQTLDSIEGFYGYDSEHSLFSRTIVQIETEHGAEWAWTYVYNQEEGIEYQEIISGNWRNR
ncbi:MAG TPA: gamma-glutamylcyclotransferase [Candidatus Poseidoniaceae archaeon]|nr:gamma-glutamylcyclotransferase [Candidatus Poseidoniaceae archaeon]